MFEEIREICPHHSRSPALAAEVLGMKQTIQTILRSVPPAFLFLGAFGAVVAFGVVKLLALLRDAGVNA